MTERVFEDSVAQHKKKSHISAGVAVITLSTSRSIDRDESGDVIKKLLEEGGHKVIVRRVIPDNRDILGATLQEVLQNQDVHAIVTTGGTGISSTDITVETVQGMLDKELPGFNSLFMFLSYSQVKSAAMLSRALAGSIKGKLIFCLPGSPRACTLAMESLIVPELGHMLTMLGS